VAAQTARDRKKARMTELEEMVAQLEEEVSLKIIILINVFERFSVVIFKLPYAEILVNTRVMATQYPRCNI